MNMNREQLFNALIENIKKDRSLDKYIPKESHKIIEILRALSGYLTEEGTDFEQDKLLREIGCMPPKI